MESPASRELGLLAKGSVELARFTLAPGFRIVVLREPGLLVGILVLHDDSPVSLSDQTLS